ncbi:MAG: DUF1456 family protein [Roseibacillus sp.]
MTKNDILRRLRYAFEINDADIVKIIAHTGEEVSVKEVVNWLKKETDHNCVEISDAMLCRFLDGYIIEKRGLRSDGTIPVPLEFLSNNEVLRKLRIALELRDEDMNAVFEKTEFVVTKAELSSFFRKEGHRNYRKCPEQVLRKFIQGLGRQREE